MNLFQIAIMKSQLKDPENVIAVPDPVLRAELIVCGIPSDRIKVLTCLEYLENKCLVMTEDQYEDYSRKERELIEEAGQ